MTFSMQPGGFQVIDYVIFLVLTIGSCSGGIWYSAVGSKRKAVADLDDYLLGGRQMKTFPVAISLIASYFSGVTLLGTPAEMYNYGTQYWLVIIGAGASCVVVVIVYLPIFTTLLLSSSYEYLELRFHRKIRAVVSVLFLIDELLFLPMVIYLPSLSLEQLTGYNVFLIGGITMVGCGLYTALGGLKAVVVTDAWQTYLMFIAAIVVAIAGTVAVGGMGTLWHVSKISGRIDWRNWDLSPYVRQTGWGAVVGGFCYWTCFNSVNQTMVQRYISLPSRAKAILAIFIFWLGAALTITLCVWCGLAAWVIWVQGGCAKGAEPIVEDKLLPAFVTYLAKTKKLPGLPGIFIAGVFGTALSSLSAILNACALVLIEDIMHGWLQVRLKPLTEGLIARLLTLILSIISVAMIAVIRQLGGILGVASALSAIASSTTCGVFTLGMIAWWVGTRGAMAGAIGGAVISGGMSLGIQAATAAGLKAPFMPYEGVCPGAPNRVFNDTFDPTKVFPLFRFSYHWVAPMGFFATVIVGAAAGYFLDKRDEIPLDAELFSPVIWRLLPPEAHTNKGITRRDRQANNPTAPKSDVKSSTGKPDTKSSKAKPDDKSPSSKPDTKSPET